tara:strand:+ start:474 stop:683 length:210 start_codon:yes stop_codon:yes gene_type:complete
MNIKYQTILSVVVILLCMFYLSNQDTKIKQEDLVKQWKPRDFYLVYKMWTDKDLIELKKQIEKDSKVYP